ncbi:MAG: hypothetical protein HXY40_08270 [Chloroflexi bacterium]|nr:hypothetical protein [Chloroflexota bacterium]
MRKNSRIYSRIYRLWLEGALLENAPGALVFQTDWDDLLYRFYGSRHKIYLIGLAPTSWQLADSARWHTWVAITQGLIAQPSARPMASVTLVTMHLSPRIATIAGCNWCAAPSTAMSGVC